MMATEGSLNGRIPSNGINGLNDPETVESRVEGCIIPPQPRIMTPFMQFFHNHRLQNKKPNDQARNDLKEMAHTNGNVTGHSVDNTNGLTKATPARKRKPSNTISDLAELAANARAELKVKVGLDNSHVVDNGTDVKDRTRLLVDDLRPTKRRKSDNEESHRTSERRSRSFSTPNDNMEAVALLLGLAGQATKLTNIKVESPPQDDTATSMAGQRVRRGWPKGKSRGPRKSSNPVVDTPIQAQSSSEEVQDNSLTNGKADDMEGLEITHSTMTTVINESGQLEHEILSATSNGDKAIPVMENATKITPDPVCVGCKTTRVSTTGETDDWIECNGCKGWFHVDCAGFTDAKEVERVAQYYCKDCDPDGKKTTMKRKSARAHASVDYAGLNEGILKTSDDNHEHHYIQPIKDGTLYQFDQERFPRIRPELITREFLEKSALFQEPIVIPAEWNPRPTTNSTEGLNKADTTSGKMEKKVDNTDDEDERLDQFEYEMTSDNGQDKLDMVIPPEFTVRQVRNLLGSAYPIEAIDVKIQGSQKWTLGNWADYYDSEKKDVILNVISLEVNETVFGRLLKRPKVVRDIDLQDNVWPKDEQFKSVAFFCLMSVADSFTDFHVDFGGSSVYYHIVRGSKTFFFIPPKPKHIKAYEEWNNSREQNYTFLPDTTKECYRIDLVAGDTMLIPSGWIHAVWTPSDSLVIGGNFLTHMHYSMQFDIVESEKANKIPLKFRYPKFQRVMWYAVIKYLKDDPLPEAVRQTFYAGKQFARDMPIWQDFDETFKSNEAGSDEYNSRYYSEMEMNGWHDLCNYIIRTVMVLEDRIDGITAESRKAIIASIPKNYGDPFAIAKSFALWVAWKRGNEDPPNWAHADASLPEKEAAVPKKMTEKQVKALQRQQAFEAWKASDHRSRRQRGSLNVQSEKEESTAPQDQVLSLVDEYKDIHTDSVLQISEVDHQADPVTLPTSVPASLPNQNSSSKRTACDTCRKRRIRCIHDSNGQAIVAEKAGKESNTRRISGRRSNSNSSQSPIDTVENDSLIQADALVTTASNAEINDTSTSPPNSNAPVPNNSFGQQDENNTKSSRIIACDSCRKSKRRCVHNNNPRYRLPEDSPLLDDIPYVDWCGTNAACEMEMFHDMASAPFESELLKSIKTSPDELDMKHKLEHVDTLPSAGVGPIANRVALEYTRHGSTESMMKEEKKNGSSIDSGVELGNTIGREQDDETLSKSLSNSAQRIKEEQKPELTTPPARILDDVKVITRRRSTRQNNTVEEVKDNHISTQQDVKPLPDLKNGRSTNKRRLTSKLSTHSPIKKMKGMRSVSDNNTTTAPTTTNLDDEEMTVGNDPSYEESLRLAREMQNQFSGLRKRSSLG